MSGARIVNGTSLHCEVDGSGPPVVLIHGFGLDLRMWDDQFGVFAKTHRVVRYDMRGFGRSPPPPLGEGYTHAGDLRALLQQLGIGKASLVGLSLGGLVGMNFATAFPDMVDRLVLADPALAGHAWSADWKRSMDAIDAMAASSGARAANTLWLDHPLFAPARGRGGAVAARLAEMVSGYSGWHWVNDDPQVESRPPDIERLGEIGSPTLIVMGERDLPDFHAIARLLQSKIPGARVESVRGAGHMVNMEAPGPFNRITLAFLDRKT